MIMIKNWFLNFGGIVIMNAVLQFVVFPSLNNEMGAQKYGIVLYLLSFIIIFAPSFGQSVMNIRLVERKTKGYQNGDYNLVLFLFCFIAVFITLAIAHESIRDTQEYFFLSILLILTIFRYYSDVEFRMNFTFRNYYIYYLILTFGYLIGFLFYYIFNNWLLIFIIGEFLALLYVWQNGEIYEEFFKITSNFTLCFKSSLILALSYLLFNLSLQMDRIILKFFAGSTSVSEYYVVSVFGKALVLIIAPLNSILLSYLSKKKELIELKDFTIGILILSIGCIIFLGIAQVFVPVYIKIFYPSLLSSVSGIIFVANLSQIFNIASTTLFAVILTFAHEKWQLISQSMNIIIFICLSIPMTINNGIEGFANAALLSSIIRIISTMIIGIFRLKYNKLVVQ